MKSRKKLFLYCMLLSIFHTLSTIRAHAFDGGDPGYPPVVLTAQEIIGSALAKEQPIRTAQAVANDALSRSKRAIEKCQTLYNQYLDSLQNTAYIVGELLGIAAESEVLIENFTYFGKVCKSYPLNLFAAAIDDSSIYVEAANTAMEAFRSLRDAVLSTYAANTKMNVTERMQIFSKVRPKLAELNRKIARLGLMVKYTSFNYLLGMMPRLPDRNTLYGQVATEALTKWLDVPSRLYIANKGK